MLTSRWKSVYLMLMAHTFEVRDLRNKGYFMIDDAYLNGYSRIFGPTASMVYFSLCRHCDKEQKSFPPQRLIGQELNVNERTVRRMIKKLIDANLVSIEKHRTEKGKWLNNSYYLLDKSVWKTKEELARGHSCPMDTQRTNGPSAGGHPCPIKETHTKKETHIKDYWIKKNPIINDKAFLKWVSGDYRGLDHLNNAYPLNKYEEAWKQAKQYKSSL